MSILGRSFGLLFSREHFFFGSAICRADAWLVWLVQFWGGLLPVVLLYAMRGLEPPPPFDVVLGWTLLTLSLIAILVFLWAAIALVHRRLRAVVNPVKKRHWCFVYIPIVLVGWLLVSGYTMALQEGENQGSTAFIMTLLLVEVVSLIFSVYALVLILFKDKNQSVRS